MAKSRFSIDKDGNVIQVGKPVTGDPTKDAAWDKLLEAEQKLLEDYSKKLITADELQKELKDLIQQYRKLLGLTIDQVNKRSEAFDSGIESVAQRTGTPGLTSEQRKRDEAAKQEEIDRKREEYEKKHRFEQAKHNVSQQRQKSQTLPGVAKLIGARQSRVNSYANRARSIGQNIRTASKMAGGNSTRAGRFLGSASKGIGAGAGPVAVVYEVADKIADTITGISKVANQFISSIGKMSQSVAGNDGMGMFNQWSESFQSTISKIGPAGKVVAAGLSTATAAVNTFAKTVNAFNNRARELMGLSGANTAAIAQADVNKLLADIREAQSLDKEYAEIVKSQTKISTNFQDALTPIKRILMQILQGPLSFIETLSNGLVYISKLVDEGYKTLKEAGGALASMLPAVGILDKIKAKIDAAVKAEEKDRDNKAAALFNAMLMMDINVNDRTPDAAFGARVDAVPLGIPKFR